MIAPAGAATTATAAAAWLCLSLSTEPAMMMPVLDVIQVYGRLAGPSCFGRAAPAGSSCQLTREELKQKLGLVSSDVALSREEFRDRLDELSFQWPLKPYGVDKSLDKTAVINKGAETSIYMQQLQSAGLYDPRNPTGPLPSSLRPNLNEVLQKQGLSAATVDRVYYILLDKGGKSTDNKMMTIETIDRLFQTVIPEGGSESSAWDYYDFVRLLGGADSVSWR
jgi:hypothetical protein